MLRRAACILAVLMLCLGLSAARAADENLIRNGDFAVDSDRDGMADGWHFSGDGVDVTWSRAEGNDGPYSQRLTCTSFTDIGPASHVMLAQEDTFALQEDQWYHIRFNVRGENESGIAYVAIQQTGPWEMLGLFSMFRIRPEWRHQSFVFPASKTVAEHIRLQIWFVGTGTMWVDSVTLAKSEGGHQVRRYRETVADLGTKNLIPNSSFECGRSGWGSTGTTLGWIGGLNTLYGEIDRGTAAVHGASFRIDLDKADPPVLAWDWPHASRVPVEFLVVANRGWIGVAPGTPHTLSAYVKSDPAGAPCALVVQEAFGGLLRHDFTASGEWQRVSFTFTPSASQVHVAVGPDLTASELPRVSVWVDGVQLERGAQATVYEPRAPLEIGLEWEKPGHLFASPSQAKAVVIAFNAGESELRTRVRASLTDFFDRSTSAPVLDLALPPATAVRHDLPLGVTRKGFYRFTLASDAGAVIPVGAERLAVIDPCTDSDGIFGMNHAYPTPELLRLSKQLGLTWFRDWSLKWQQVEPEKGRFTFSDTDYQIDRVREEGLNVLGLLPFPSSEWSSTAPAEGVSNRDLGESARQAYMPRDLGEFAEYVRRTVTQYRDRIRVWEILNEPIYTGYALPAANGHTVDDYVAVLRTACQAVKEVDPKAFVVGGIAGSPTTYVKEFVAAGGLHGMDALNLHIYPVLVPPEAYLPQLEALEAMLEETAPGMPIYFTEGGYYGDDDPPFDPYRAGDNLLAPLDSELECASYLARLGIILLSRNTRKVIVHCGVSGRLNHDAVESIYFEWDGAPRKMAVSQSTMAALFGADTKFVGTVWDTVRSFAFHSRGRTVVALWDERQRHHTVRPRPGTRLLDLAGASVSGTVEVGETPHFLVVDGAQPLGRIRSALEGCLQ